MNPLAICAIVRNEAPPYIDEWIEFHRLQGTDFFVLYDDRSEDDTVERAMCHKGVTVYRHSREWDNSLYDGIACLNSWPTTPQCHAFQHFGSHYHGNFWCAFIDVDEFLWHDHWNRVADFLEGYQEYPALVANWAIFGSNGHLTRPQGLTIEAYTRRAPVGEPEPWGRHVKAIVNMSHRHGWGPNGSHCPLFACHGREAITQRFAPNPWSMTPQADIDGLRVNHYYHRSKAEGAAKAAKVDHNAPPGYPNPERVAAHDRNEIEDTAILRFLPALKEAMK